MAFRLHFFLLRLRRSSPSELFFRIRQNAALLHLKLSTKLGGLLKKTPVIDKSEIEKLSIPDIIPEALIGSDDVLNLTDWDHPQNPWQFDANAVETDIRIRWESARLQQATALITFAHQNPQAPECCMAKQAAKTLLLYWVKTNPFYQCENYLSAMECALRVPVFFYAIKRLDNLASDDYARILQSIYLHAKLVSKHLSLYSSLGNHTISEAVGLIFGGAVYKSTREGVQWLKTGIRLLGDELPHQILADGGPAEQSLGYHRFVLDLYWLAFDFIHKNNLGDVHQWQPRLSAGECFLSTFRDSHGNIPSIGDSDDGCAIAPGISPFRFTGNGISENHIIFKDSGYSVIRNDRLVFSFDHGPLGMAPFYNHGHADALSISLSKNGRPLLVDPGTYRYNGVDKWRRYFKGTRAHNTVTIDNQDQAIQETSFIWSKPYQSKLAACKEIDGDLFCRAVHDGYTRFKTPVQHHRSILYFDQANFLIKDRFCGTGTHRFELNFHLHPDATVSQNGPWWVVDHGEARVFLRLLEFDFQVVRGQADPLLGWYSDRYGHKEPTCTLTCAQSGTAANIVFTTAIFTHSPVNDTNTSTKANLIEG